MSVGMISTEETEQGTSPQLRSAGSVRGKVLLAVLSVVVAGFLALNVWAARTNQSDARKAKEVAVLMADRSQVSQVWKETADGMTATFVAVDSDDGVRVSSIRSYLRKQRIQHLRADYSDVRFEGRALPGRPELEYGTENLKLNVRYRDVAGGGELRFIGTDGDRDIMMASLLEWSAAVQRG